LAVVAGEVDVTEIDRAQHYFSGELWSRDEPAPTLSSYVLLNTDGGSVPVMTNEHVDGTAAR